MSGDRVAMVLNTIGFGGVPQVVYHLMKRLAGGDLDLRLYVLKDTDPADPGRQARLAQFQDLAIPVSFGSGEGGKMGSVSDLVAWLEDERIDLLHTHSYRPNLYARMAGVICRTRGLRVIAHYHNHYDDKWRQAPSSLVLERQLAGSSDALMAVSDSVRGHICDCLGLEQSKVDVVPNGVDAEPFQGIDPVAARQKLGIEKDAIVVGLVGRICRQKGQDDFVEAALLVLQAHPDVRFIMFGDIEDTKLHRRLVERIEATGTADRIRIAGHVTDMPAAYAAIDILALASRWEGFVLTMLEGMAAGRPVVATPVGAIPDVTEDGKNIDLVPVGDPQALAAAIVRQIEDPCRRAALAAEGRKLQAGYSWDASTERVRRIYDRVLNGGALGVQ